MNFYRRAKIVVRSAGLILEDKEIVPRERVVAKKYVRPRHVPVLRKDNSGVVFCFEVPFCFFP